MSRRAACGFGVVVCFAASAACHRSHAAGTSRTALDADRGAENDSIAGMISVVGTAEFPQMLLVRDDGSSSVALDSASLLRAVAGLRVGVVGVRRGARFVVQRFVVLSANGIPAVDGMIALDGDAVVLVTAGGQRVRVVRPPQALRANVGRRAWIAGQTGSEPVSYGIIK